MSSDPMTAPVGPAQETDKTPESAGEPEPEVRDPVMSSHALSVPAFAILVLLAFKMLQG